MQNKPRSFRPHKKVGRTSFFYLLPLLLLCGCVEHRYYVSPFNGNNGTYHPIPTKSDSVKSGYYAGAGIAVGSANDEGVDDVFAFHTSISGGHTLGALQGFYSFSFAAGNYKVDSADGVNHPGNKAFSGFGFEGGLNAVVPFSNGEWRIIGVETSLWNESGKYLHFRKALPDAGATSSDAIDLVIKNATFRTLGGYTEIIADQGNMTFGLRLAAGTVLSRHYSFIDPYSEPPYRREKYRYVSLTTHLTRKRYTGFLKLNLATKASTALFGLNYRIR